MADNLNEQELQALFRKHLPMKQMPADFADQLKKQVLAEVASTLAAKPMASVINQEISPAQTPIQEQAPQRPAPRSVAVRTRPDTRVGWLEWLRGSLRLAPSMVTAGALVMALYLVIVFRDQIRLRLPIFPPDTAGPIEELPSPTPTAVTGMAEATPITATITATPVPPTTQATAVGNEIVAPTASAALQEEGMPEAAVVTAEPADSATKPFVGNGSVTAPVDPTDTLTPMANESESGGNTSTDGATLTPVPSTTPTRESAPGITVPDTPIKATPTPTSRPSTAQSTVAPTNTSVSDRVITPTSEATRRLVPTDTPFGFFVTVVTATRTPDADTVSTVSPPFEPSPTPTKTPTPTFVLQPTVNATVTIQPWRPSPTPTNTETPTDTPVPTDTPTPEPSPTATKAPTETGTPETAATVTQTSVPTSTSTRRPTMTATTVPTATDTPEPTNTLVPTLPPPTNTPRPTATDTPTPLPTSTPTATNTPLPTATDTATPLPTNTPLPTSTPTATWTPIPTDTPTVVSTETPTNVPPDIVDNAPPPATAGVSYEHIVIAVDYDGPSDALRFNVVEHPAWLFSQDWLSNPALSPGELKLFGTPTNDDASLLNTVKIQVTDNLGFGAMKEKTFTIVVASSVAGGPVVNDVGASGASVSETLPFTGTVPISNP